MAVREQEEAGRWFSSATEGVRNQPRLYETRSPINKQQRSSACIKEYACEQGDRHSTRASHFTHLTIAAMARHKHRVPVGSPHTWVQWRWKWVQGRRSPSKSTQRRLALHRGPRTCFEDIKKMQWNFKKYLWVQTLMLCHYTENNDIERKRKRRQPLISIRSFLIHN